MGQILNGRLGFSILSQCSFHYIQLCQIHSCCDLSLDTSSWQVHLLCRSETGRISHYVLYFTCTLVLQDRLVTLLLIFSAMHLIVQIVM